MAPSKNIFQPIVSDDSSPGKRVPLSLHDTMISSISHWTDRKWVFDGRGPGAQISTVTCIWDFKFHDGSTLFDPEHSRLLNEARHLFWSLFFDRQDGRLLKTTSVGTVFGALKRILKWMVENNYTNFSELDNRASERFCDWLVYIYSTPQVEINDESEVDLVDIDNESSEDDDVNSNIGIGNNNSLEDVDGVTAGALSPSLRVWQYLWQQRHFLASYGIGSLKQVPFNGRAVHDVASELVSNVSIRIPALPDAIAVPLMNAAHQFISMGAEDLIELVNKIFHIRKECSVSGASVNLQNIRIRSALSDFKFARPESSALPWHKPLNRNKPVQELRGLVDDLVDACVVAIQSETGMRIGEISSIPSGINTTTGLPACITVRLSKSGMLDLYYITATLSKMRPTPVQEEWLLAAAPHGISELPDTVKAVVVLQQLLAPFRAMSRSNAAEHLIITFGVPIGFPLSGENVTPPNNNLIRNGQKSFSSRYVDWDQIIETEETRPYKLTNGRCIRTQQWRKNYAQYVFQVDKRMLPAISRQFKHRSIAMTEGAYVGTSSSLVQGVADFNRNLTSEVFLQNIRGKPSKQEGRLTKLMDKYQSELTKIVEGLNEEEARAAIKTWCRSRDMKIYFHGYGKCIPAVAPTKAECHKRANTVHWANKEPNYATREPSVCTGCYLFMADQENIDYWTNRYVENMTIWAEAEARGEANQYRVARTRAEQSKGYLVTLNAPIPIIEVAHAR